MREKNAVTHNPVKGVKRPKVESYEGKTPALGDQKIEELGVFREVRRERHHDGSKRLCHPPERRSELEPRSRIERVNGVQTLREAFWRRLNSGHKVDTRSLRGDNYLILMGADGLEPPTFAL